MKFVPKRWVGMGLGAAMLGAAGLTACGNEQVADTAAAPVDHMGHAAAPVTDGGENGEGEGAFPAMDPMAVLPVEKRLAFMSGHVQAGLALYRAGVPEQAARHLSHPVSETHANERAGLDALGFKPDVFLQVSADLEAGKSAAEIEPLLAEAEANMTDMRAAAGGDPKALIEYLMKTTADEYGLGVKDGEIVNAGEYQDAYGFAVVARNIAAAQDPATYGALKTELDVLVLMWPKKGPLADSIPAPELLMAEQLARVKTALASVS